MRARLLSVWLAATLLARPRTPRPHGRLTARKCAATFTIGGQPLYIEKRGGRGPIVVFQSGLGADSEAWRDVAGPISGFAQVVRYDRAGLGMSKPLASPGRPITARRVADALDRLLAQADLRPPFILVGHSLGGL